jgi:hypothetical protein
MSECLQIVLYLPIINLNTHIIYFMFAHINLIESLCLSTSHFISTIIIHHTVVLRRIIFLAPLGSFYISQAYLFIYTYTFLHIGICMYVMIYYYPILSTLPFTFEETVRFSLLFLQLLFHGKNFNYATDYFFKYPSIIC